MVEVTDAELDRLVELLTVRLREASTNDRRYERPMSWEQADLLLAAITALRAWIVEDQAQIVALTTYRENLRDEVIELRARIAELEAFKFQRCQST